MNETTTEPTGIHHIYGEGCREPEITEPEPTQDGVTDAVNDIETITHELEAAVNEMEGAGLGAFITEANRERIERIKAGILAPEPVTSEAADAMVKEFSSILSAAECRQAERENPQPEITEPDPLKARIIGMMTENTGCDILDSGGAHGRQWQRNRHIKEWDDIPACEVEVCADGREDGEVIISYNIYPYLRLFLDINEESERLNAILEVIIATSGNKAYPADVKDFLRVIDADSEGYACGGANTYNYDNILSGVLQYDIFEVDGETYIALQIHGGCDVRGGYTAPQVFTLNEPGYFIGAQVDISAWCGCGNWSSDDAGYNWYFEGCAPSKPADWFYNREDNTVRCLDCRQAVRFGVTDSV